MRITIIRSSFKEGVQLGNVQILSPDDRKQWDELAMSIVDPDIYWLSGYCSLYESGQEESARLFIYKEDTGTVMYPFVLRQVNTLPHIKRLWEDAPEMYDIITPYGYGGPICTSLHDEDRNGLLGRFQQAFSNYCKEQKIITEFVRFHPLYRNHQDYMDVDPCFVRNTISVDLEPAVDDIFAKFSSKNRNRIRVSLKSGLFGRQETMTLERLQFFIDMYYHTMDRVKAQASYYFTEQYFYDMLDRLSDQLTMLGIYAEDELVCASIFLHEGEHVHYHLLASNERYFSCAPNNFLLYFAIQHFKERGFKKIHLGGGYTGNDSLYRFKKGFNNHEPLDFYVGRKVRDPYLYKLLKSKFNGITESEYFPFYRDPSLMAVGIDSAEVTQYV